MTLLQPPSFLQARTDHTAQEDRLYLQGLLNPIGGVGALSAPLVRAQAVPNMTVIVAKERFFIPGTESTSQGVYHGYNDGDITVTIAASSPTLPRIDIICASVQDAFYSGASNQLVVDKVTGTPNASPTPPAAPANAIIIAQIAVAAAATTVTNANITNNAQPVSAKGGLLPVGSQAIRDALTLYDGLGVYRMDTNNVEFYNGTSWDTFTPKIAQPVGAVRAYRNAALSFGITTSDIAFDTASYDYSAGAFNFTTGVFTAPKTGLYRIHSKVGVSNSTTSCGWTLIFANSANTVLSVPDQCVLRSMTAGDAESLVGSDDIPLTAGDTLKVRVVATVGTTTINAQATSTYVNISQVA